MCVSIIEHQPCCFLEVLREIAVQRCSLGNISALSMDFCNHATVSQSFSQRNRNAEVIYVTEI